MESIAAVRPNMAVLDQNKLTLSPFGALSHALAEEILARTGQAEGVYPYVPLELLTEPEEGPEEKKEEPAVNVEVKLTLELTKEARELRERTETVERILERIERIREKSESVQKPQGRERDSAPSLESRSFFQNINQHISFPMTLSVPDAAGTAQPGGIARISEKFVSTLKTMREEGLYTEPGGETRRVADAGRREAVTAGNKAAESGAVPGGTERATADRAAASGQPDGSAGDFAVRAAETALNTAETAGRSPERSPEMTARAAERMGQTIAERTAREITEQFQEIVKRETQAEGGAVPGRDGGAGTAAQYIDDERGRTAREDIETERPSRTEAAADTAKMGTARENGETGPVRESGHREETARAGEAGFVGAVSPDERPAEVERPAEAVADRGIPFAPAPEELAHRTEEPAAPEGEAGTRTGDRVRPVGKAHNAGESRVRHEDESGAAPRRAGKEGARASADEHTAETAHKTGTADRAEGRAAAVETGKTGHSQRADSSQGTDRSQGTDSSQRADSSQRTDSSQGAGSSQRADSPQRADSSQGTDSSQRAVSSQGADNSQRADSSQRTDSFQKPVSAPGAGKEMPVPEAGQGREGYVPEEPERTVLDRERSESALSPEEPGTETPEARPERARSGIAPEGGAREADGGMRSEAEAIPLRGETAPPAPEELALSPAAERSGKELPTAGRQAAGDAPRLVDRAGSATGPAQTNGTPGTGAAVDTARKETVRENGETAPVREAGQSAAAARAEETSPAGTQSPDEWAGRAERPAEAIPNHERPFMPAPEELAHRTEELTHRTEEPAMPEGDAGTRTGDRARHAGESRDAEGVRDVREAGKVRDAGETYKAGESRNTEGVRDVREAGEVRDAGETYKADEVRDAEKVRDAGEAHNAGEARDTEAAHDAETVHRAGEAYRAGGRVEPSTAEAIPLRGALGELTPEELALAPLEGTAQPDADSQAGAARRAAAQEKRDTRSPSGETVPIDTGTGRPGKAPVVAREDSEEVTAEAGRASKSPTEAGRTSEKSDAEAGRASKSPAKAGRTSEKSDAEAGRTSKSPAEAGRTSEKSDAETGRTSERPAAGAGKAGERGTSEEALPKPGTVEGGEPGQAEGPAAAHRVGEVRDAEGDHRIGERLEPGAAEAIPLRGTLGEITSEELALARAEEAARPDADSQDGAAHRAPAREKRDTRFPNGETVPIDAGTGRPAETSATVREDSEKTAGEVGSTTERSAVRAGKAGEPGKAERHAKAIPDQAMLSAPTPEELAYRTEEPAVPESGATARTDGAAHHVGKVHDVGEVRHAGEAYDTGKARHTGEVRKAEEIRRVGDAGEAYRTGETRDVGEAHPSGKRFEPGAAEAIPLRGTLGERTPEELALARAEETARPDAESKTGAAHRAAAHTKRDTHFPNGERDPIDAGTGRPGETPAAVRKNAGEAAGEAGRASERTGEAGITSETTTGRTGKAGESGTAEGEFHQIGTAEAGETGKAERPAEAIPEHETPFAPAPEELAHRTEETAPPEGGAILGPGSTAKSVEAFAERVAERVRRAETTGLGTGVRDRGPMSPARRGTGTELPRHDSVIGAGTVIFPPPVELAGAAEGPREAESASTGIPAQPARESAGGVSESLRTAQGAQAAYGPESLEYGAAPVTPAGEASPDGTARVSGREIRRAPRPAERAVGGRAAAGPAPVELTYGGQGEARPAEQPKSQPAGNIAESDYVKSLPDWARRFLKEGAGSLGTAAGSMAVTAIPNAQAAQGQQPQMMEWTAPGFRQQPPAETQFKELKPPEDTGGQAGEVHISDAEIRRTADRVYKIIEDRIRRERRRLGL